VERVGGPAGGKVQDFSKVSCKKPCSKIPPLDVTPCLRDVNPRLRPVGCSLRVVGRLLRDVGRIPERRGETKKEGKKERKKLSKKIANAKVKSCGGFFLFSSLFLYNTKTLMRDILKC
jgi:hypothetical protein